MLVLAPALKKKSSAGKGLPNGGIGHSVSPMGNGTHCSKSALNGKDSEKNAGEIQHVNGHTAGDSTELSLKEFSDFGAGSYKIDREHYRSYQQSVLHFPLKLIVCSRETARKLQLCL